MACSYVLLNLLQMPNDTIQSLADLTPHCSARCRHQPIQTPVHTTQTLLLTVPRFV